MKINAMKYIQTIILTLLCSLPMKAQEEFLRPGGGMSLAYSHANSPEISTNAMGVNFTFKPGLSIGVASQQLGSETKPLFMAGFITDHKELNAYKRLGINVSYCGSNTVNSFGIHGSIAQLFNAQKNYPTSISLNFSAVNFVFKESSNYYFSEPAQLVPVVALALTQALAANSTLMPFLGIGLGHELKNNTSSFMLSIGLNLNFDGPKL